MPLSPLSRRSTVDARPNLLSEALAARRAAGRPILDLTGSNPTRAGIPYDAPAILGALASPGATVYEPAAFGLPVARRAVADLWARRGVTVDPAHVVLTASTSEAYAFLFALLCDPGEAVLVPRPSYPLLDHLARYSGVELIPYPLAYDGAWHVDLPRLSAAVTPRARAVVAVSPNNPTGSFLAPDELLAISNLGLPVISDEVFGEYSLRDGSPRVRTALVAEDTLVFALDGLSKLAGLPQMKLAWITVGGPGPLVEEALAGLELIADTFLSPSGPVQHALPTLLERAELPRMAILARARSNDAVLRDLVRSTAVTALSADGGWCAVLRLPAVETEEAWVTALLDQGVLVQPGWFYDFAFEPVIVVSLLTPEADFEAGVTRIVQLAGGGSFGGAA